MGFRSVRSIGDRAGFRGAGTHTSDGFTCLEVGLIVHGRQHIPRRHLEDCVAQVGASARDRELLG